MPSPRHNTTKAFPAVAKGFFKMLEDTGELELGDVIYVPEYFSCSVSTLRSGGLSVGDTCRSDNKTSFVKKIFAPGHQAMYLLATEVYRHENDNMHPGVRWDGSGMVLVPANPRTGGRDNQIVTPSTPRTPPLRHAEFLAIPAAAFSRKTVAEAVAASNAVSLAKLRGTAAARMVEQLGDNYRDVFLMRDDANGCEGIPLPADARRDLGAWLIHSVLDYASTHCGGVDGSSNITEAWRRDGYETSAKTLVGEISGRYLSVPESWRKAALTVRRLDYRDRENSTNTMSFLEFLKDHGCTFLHRDGFWDDIRDQMVREMADQMVERIAKTAGVLREFLPVAVDKAFERLDNLADKWADFRDRVNPDTYVSPASALAEAEPSTRYGVRRR